MKKNIIYSRKEERRKILFIRFKVSIRCVRSEREATRVKRVRDITWQPPLGQEGKSRLLGPHVD